jgi:phosphoglycolate phosphatase
MQYKVIAFDFDGTLADSFDLFLEAMAVAADKHGIPDLPRDQIDVLRGMSSQELMRHLGIPMWKLPGIGATMRRLMTKGASKVSLFPGTAEMLTGLRAAGMMTAIVTSSSRESVRTVLGDLQDQVDFLECGISLFGKHGKLAQLARHARARPKDVLYIGDELRDADAADAAKVDFGGVAWGYTQPYVLARRSSLEIFTTPRQVMEMLSRADGAN